MDSPLTIFLVTPPHVKMEILPPCMIGSIRVGELGKKWAWVFRQRVEFQLVYDIADGLVVQGGQRVRGDMKSSARLPSSGNVRSSPRRQEAAALPAKLSWTLKS
jgi:hypothetical protein